MRMDSQNFFFEKMYLYKNGKTEYFSEFKRVSEKKFWNLIENCLKCREN